MSARYTVGVDFGTASGRAVLVDCSNGHEAATAVSTYSNGVIDQHLPAPDSDIVLESSWALQDPADYLRVFQETIPALLAETAVDPAQIVGVGIDFTSCTMLPTLADGTPLCMLPELRRNPHAWVKLWKHHAAQPEADLINEVAVARGEPWLERYGGKISSEWFFAKSLQILREAPEIYARADRLIEAADWAVWQLTGVETRSSCAAGYKAMWSSTDGFPSAEYFAALDPGFARVVDEKLSRRVLPLGDRAGLIDQRGAGWTGLLAGTPVAVATVDAHASAPAVGVTSAGALVMIMGTSTCHILLADRAVTVPGMCGAVEDGVVPGLWGYEAGQSGVGDIFAWFTEIAKTPHDVLEADAAKLRPGESGLLALDWWNGNRSVLVNADLSGLLLGMTLATGPAEVYRALIEATAFGTRLIVEAFEASGVAVDSIIACGGLPERNTLLLQVYADVLRRPVTVAASTQAPALGAAMFAAVAGGVYSSIAEASGCMTRPAQKTVAPDAEAGRVYDQLFAEYVRLHDLFGRGGSDVMRSLGDLRLAARR